MVKVGIGSQAANSSAVSEFGNSTEPHLHIPFTDAWPPAANAMESYVLSQGVPAAFWAGQVYRDGDLFE